MQRSRKFHPGAAVVWQEAVLLTCDHGDVSMASTRLPGPGGEPVDGDAGRAEPSYLATMVTARISARSNRTPGALAAEGPSFRQRREPHPPTLSFPRKESNYP
jgi:hypothetical protein